MSPPSNHRGETDEMSISETPKHIVARIDALHSMRWLDLKALWTCLFGSPPGINNRRYVIRRLAHRLQEDAAREIDPDLLSSNDDRIRHLIATGALKPKAKKIVSAGQVITKNHHGVLHSVRVLGKGRFEYSGKLYTSLSAIARQITGTRWSGPAFFGIKSTTPSKAKSR